LRKSTAIRILIKRIFCNYTDGQEAPADETEEEDAGMIVKANFN